MPYFVRIGAIKNNKSGIGARGYQLLRRGRVIIARWGAVKVLPGRRFHWVYRVERKFVKRSDAIAKAKLRTLIEERSSTYSKLPTGARIFH